MNNFNINKDIQYVADLKGVAVLNTKENINTFMEYPEAAVWLVFIEGHKLKKTHKMLEAIIGANQAETMEYMNKCIDNWKNTGLIK